MTLATDMMWDANPSARLSLTAIRYDRALTFTAVVGAGVAFSMWSMATMATLHTVESSVVSASRILPESAFLPGTVALVDPLQRVARFARSSISPLVAGRQSVSSTHRLAERLPRVAKDNGRSARYASVVVEGSKTRRLAPLRQARLSAAAEDAKTPLELRFDQVVADASLTPAKRAAAFARPTQAVAEAERSNRVAVAEIDNAPALPAAAPAPAAMPISDVPLPSYAPAQARFGTELPDQAPVPGREPAPSHATPAVAEVEKSAQMALAAVGSSQSDGSDVPPSPLHGNAPLREASLSAQDDDADQATQDGQGLADAIPDSVPLPTSRPELDQGIPFKPSEPAQHKSDEMLAYARPDEPVTREQPKPFKNLNLPGPNSGIAVYDIKAATVYMPNGERLEAHSGLGRFTDNPAFVNRRDVGPTPPNTYKLTLREATFHGVQAIRMTPVTDQKMYGRDGFLVHTYMLRGRYAQSNGCVVFKNYDKFLRAFKRGKVTQLVVVPSLSGHSVFAQQQQEKRWSLFKIFQDNRGA